MPSRGDYEGHPGVVEPGGCVDAAVCQHDWRRDSGLSVYPANSFTCTKCGADKLRWAESRIAELEAEVAAEVAAVVNTPAAEQVCCICKQPCLRNAEAERDRWSWGPDGMHCHFRCETEFVKRYPHLVPYGYVPRTVV